MNIETGDSYYDMSHSNRGIALIINNQEFDDKKNNRYGSEIDVKKLKKTFKKLSFKVVVLLNLKSNEIKDTIKEYSKRNYENDDCFVCVIMSHGLLKGVFGTDEIIVNYDDIFEPFKENDTLKGKPKLFFFQACRGNEEIVKTMSLKRDNLKSQSFSEENKPREFDFLLHYSTLKRYVAYINLKTGSLFIDALCKSFEENINKEIHEILLSINSKVAKHKIQVPTIDFRFTKKLVLNIKNYTKKKIGHSGDWYEGEYKDRRLNGFGTYHFSCGDKYEGDFKNSYFDGEGTYFYKNGDKYEGEWSKDQKDGFGTYYFHNGDIYEGYWKNDEKNGQGSYIYKNGDKIQGTWKNDKMKGQGTFISQNIKIYEGEWCCDLMNGKGKYYLQNGDIYEGDFKNGKFNGKGKYLYKNESKYEGEWKNDDKNGRGKYVYTNGDVYEGDYENNVKSGEGKYFYKQKQETFEGNWLHGKRDGYGCYYYQNNDTFIGKWKDNNKFLGVYFYADGSNYYGEWRHGKKNGRGTLFYSNGERYIGEWTDGKMNGKGTFQNSNYEKYHGIFSNNKLTNNMIYQSKEMIKGKWIRYSLEKDKTTWKNGFIDEIKKIDFKKMHVKWPIIDKKKYEIYLPYLKNESNSHEKIRENNLIKFKPWKY